MNYEYGSDITATSTPDSDDWGWDKYWSANDWKIWYSRLKEEYGVKIAREKWSSAWEGETADVWSGVHKYKMYPDFSKFMKDNKLVGSDFISDLAVGVQNIVSGVGNSATNLASGTEGVTEGLSSTAKKMKYILPIILLVAVIGVGAYGYKTFIK